MLILLALDSFNLDLRVEVVATISAMKVFTFTVLWSLIQFLEAPTEISR